MRILLLLFFIALFASNLSAQPQVTITNGYVGKPILPLDSGYLFARTLAPDEIFYRWDLKSFSKTEILDGEFESTVWFRMTPFPIIATPSFRYLSKPITLQNVEILGPTISKRVNYVKADNPKGTVFLFHKEGASSNEWSSNFYDQFQLVKVLHYYGYTVVFFDCEERATSSEINGDTIINWQIFPHSIDNNVDYTSAQMILNGLRTKGIVGENENLYSVGHGNGGLFAHGFAQLFEAKASVVIQSYPNLLLSSDEPTSPVLFHVAVNDKNVTNVINQLYVDSLKFVGQCASIHYTRPTPLYPQVFARTGRIPVDISLKLFEELFANNVLNDSNYLIPSQNELLNDFIANPSKWPQVRLLNSSYSTSFIRQLAISKAESEFNSNRVSAIVDFLEFPCQVNTSVSSEEKLIERTTTYFVGKDGTVILPYENKEISDLSILNTVGVVIPLPYAQYNSDEISIDFSNQPNGMYFLKDTKEHLIRILKLR